MSFMPTYYSIEWYFQCNQSGIFIWLFILYSLLKCVYGFLNCVIKHKQPYWKKGLHYKTNAANIRMPFIILVLNAPPLHHVITPALELIRQTPAIACKSTSHVQGPQKP